MRIFKPNFNNLLRNVTLLIMATLFSISATMSQPLNRFVNFYSLNDQFQSGFEDIYFTGNSYVLTGWTGRGIFESIWLVGLAEDGGLLWQESYSPDDESLTLNWAFTVIQTDDMGYVMGGGRGQGGIDFFTVLKVNQDLELEWWNDYGRSVNGCRAVIELKSGDLLAGGIDRENGYALKLDQEGEAIWSQHYENIQIIMSIRETAGGYMLAGGTYLIKVDENGDIIWEREFNSVIFSLISCRNGGFALSGSPINRDAGQFSLIRVDDDGEEIWSRAFEFDGQGNGDSDPAVSLTEMPDGGFVLVGKGLQQEHICPVLSTDESGNEQWHRLDRFWDSNNWYSSVIADEDGFAYVAGRAIPEGGNVRMGVLVKIIPLVSAPQIVSFSPENQNLHVLQGDTILFEVEAIDIQDDNLGEFSVKCVVSDSSLSDSVIWQVHVEEWYIDAYSPDSLSWRVQRPREVDFSLGVRAIEGVEPNFRWILTDREQRENDVGNEAELNYTFDIQGDYNLEGRVYYYDTEQSVNWQVAVNSVLYWWRPHERQLEAELREQIEFSLIPFNPDSDSLDYLWLVDGEDDGDVEEGMYTSFGSVGEHTVTAIVHDGAEVDTVVWTIDVVDPNAVDEDQASLLPTVVTLYPAAPNPFNSHTSIRYFLPRSAEVRLTTYDSAGRLVQTLDRGMNIAGEHIATLHGSELPAGVYLLRLETDEAVRTMKVVLLK